MLLRTLLTSLLTASIACAAWAQGATISGKIVDPLSGEAVTGCVAQIPELNRYAIAGLDGSYRLGKIPQGKYSITFSAVGYSTVEQPLVVEGSHVEVNAALPQAENKIEEVVVVGESSGLTDNSARGIEKLSMNVVNVVSARAIEISPDMTVGNVIARVSGVTVERSSSGEAQYALLRGMDKRYSYTLVNGVKIPSPDNKNRFVPLDIFPSELLDRLEVNKALTADMEGDGIGGAVNMVMKDAPAQRQLTASLSTGYNAQLVGRNDFQTFSRSGVARQSPNERHGLDYAVGMKDFTMGNLRLNAGPATPSYAGGFSYGQRMLRDKLGLMLAGSYADACRSNSSDLYSSTVEVDGSQSVTTRRFSTRQTRAGAHAKLDFAPAPNHKLMWYNAYMDFGTAQVREATSQKEQQVRLRWNHQTIFSSTLKGMHSFADRRLKLDYALSCGRAFNETPDNAQVNLKLTNGMTSVDQNTGMTRRWEHNSDNDLTAQLNALYAVKLGEASLDVATGGMLRDKVRGSFFNEYSFKPYDESKPANPREQIKGVDWSSFDEITLQANRYGYVSDPLNYDATEQIAAGYLSGKLTTARLQLIAGLRMEHTRQGYNLKFPTNGARNEGLQDYSDYLPSLHVKYSPSAKTNLRLSYTEAINRPSFFEIAPYNIINEEYKERGNPDLKRTVAHNVDLRYELFPQPSEQLMVGLFYKKMIDPIEYGFVSGYGQDTYYMPVNYGNAHNYGVELDAIKYFSWLGVKANYTFTQSRITTTKKHFIPNPDPNAETNSVVVYVNQTRPLNGQAAHVVNASLLLHEPRTGWDAQLAFSYTGQRLAIVSQWLNDDTWQAGFVQMDVSVDKRFKNGVTLFGKASNLLNSPLVQFTRLNVMNEQRDARVAMHSGGIMERRERYGQNVVLGVKYRL